MNKKNHTQIDGFIPRKRPSESSAITSDSGKSEISHDSQPSEHHHSTGISKRALTASLNSIDDESENPKKHHGGGSKRRKKKTKLIVGIVIAVLIIALVGVGFFVIRNVLAAGGSIFKGDVFGYIQKEPLKKDQNGRSNIVIFGTSEDNIEGGKQHDGAYLTDSIIVLSIDQEKKDAYMTSIPRDLWVKYDTNCFYGSEGKINALYKCYAGEQGENEIAGADALRAKLTEVTGLDIQYYVHVNYTVVRDAVDAVGGVEVDIQGTGQYAHLGILDRNFDWRCNYECYYVKYENGPSGIIDGEHALALARARGEGRETYGLANANYDREVNQQKILKSLQQKAMNAGKFGDINTVVKLIDALGSNLRTNFQTKEMRTLIDIANNVKAENITSISLIDEQEPATTVGFVGEQSVVQAVTGYYDYSSIKKYIAKKINTSPAAQEQATIAIYNASKTSGLAGQLGEQLELKGFAISTIDNVELSAEGDERYRIYQTTSTAPMTGEELSRTLDTDLMRQTPDFAYDATADYVIVIIKNPGN